MSIKFKCGHCEVVLQVKDELAGKQGRCPKCKQNILVPQPDTGGGGDELSLDAGADAAAPAASAPTPKPTPSAPAARPKPSAGESKESKLMVNNVGPIMIVTIMEPRITEISDIRAIGDELMEFLERQEKPQLLLDFSKVTYLPSAMIGKLTALHKKAESYKGGVKLCAITPGVMQIFKITRLDRVFDIHPDQSTALNSFQSKIIQA